MVRPRNFIFLVFSPLTTVNTHDDEEDQKAEDDNPKDTCPDVADELKNHLKHHLTPFALLSGLSIR